MDLGSSRLNPGHSFPFHICFWAHNTTYCLYGKIYCLRNCQFFIRMDWKLTHIFTFCNFSRKVTKNQKYTNFMHKIILWLLDHGVSIVFFVFEFHICFLAHNTRYLMYGKIYCLRNCQFFIRMYWKVTHIRAFCNFSRQFAKNQK